MAEIGDPRVSRLLIGFLRLLTGQTQTEFGRTARVDQSQLSRYENPQKTLKAPEDVVRRLAAAAGVPWPLVGLLRRFFAVFLTVLDRWSGTEAKKQEDEPLDAVLAEILELAVAPHRFERYGSGDDGETPEEERRRAEEIWEVLAPLPPPRIRELLARAPQAAASWALAERISHASEARAGNRAEEALELAQLALSITERVADEV